MRPRPAPGRRGSRHRHAGFTLVEIVVAFVLLAFVLSAGYEIFSSGLRRAGDLEDYSRAVVIAQSRLAGAGIEEAIKEGTVTGESEDRRFRWTVTYTPTAEGMPPADQPQPGPGTYMLYRVEAVVEWSAGDQRPRRFQLATLALGTRS